MSHCAGPKNPAGRTGKREPAFLAKRCAVRSFRREQASGITVSTVDTSAIPRPRAPATGAEVACQRPPTPGDSTGGMSHPALPTPRLRSSNLRHIRHQKVDQPLHRPSSSTSSNPGPGWRSPGAAVLVHFSAIGPDPQLPFREILCRSSTAGGTGAYTVRVVVLVPILGLIHPQCPCQDGPFCVAGETRSYRQDPVENPCLEQSTRGGFAARNRPGSCRRATINVSPLGPSDAGTKADIQGVEHTLRTDQRLHLAMSSVLFWALLTFGPFFPFTTLLAYFTFITSLFFQCIVHQLYSLLRASVG